MNFKLKALVAATVATVTMSGAANALTNNEIFLVAYDAAAAKTFVAALGGFGTTSTFTGTSNGSVNYGTDANWTNFITGATAGGVTYQVLGFYNTGIGGYAAADKLLVSSNATPGPLSNGSMNNIMADVRVIGGAIGNFEYLNAAVTGSSTGLVLGNGAATGNSVNVNVFNQYLAVNTTASLGSDLGFYSVTRPAATGNVVKQIVTQFVQGTTTTPDVWNLSASGLLTYTGASVAAVPEADTSAMMLAGLGLMGFVARRRRA